ncbi:unnamed protein product [Protopolystoma xenopodis]|uniref:Uncharacterized protein n=1 Tax=Protopolystoma xenopodis TaxID=117903 RepID=A0A3S5CFN0_9PLAT|nr:unnamed protein product [Protopolystoma xenopodis]
MTTGRCVIANISVGPKTVWSAPKKSHHQNEHIFSISPPELPSCGKTSTSFRLKHEHRKWTLRLRVSVAKTCPITQLGQVSNFLRELELKPLKFTGDLSNYSGVMTKPHQGSELTRHSSPVHDVKPKSAGFLSTGRRFESRHMRSAQTGRFMPRKRPNILTVPVGLLFTICWGYLIEEQDVTSPRPQSRRLHYA